MDADWRDFLTEGCFYKILNVDREARQVDLLVKFEPASECLYHRHAATTTTLVLEGELVIREGPPARRGRDAPGEARGLVLDRRRGRGAHRGQQRRRAHDRVLQLPHTGRRDLR